MLTPYDILNICPGYILFGFLPIIVLVFLLIGNFIGRENDEKYLKIDKILTTSCIFISFMCLVEMLIKYI